MELVNICDGNFERVQALKVEENFGDVMDDKIGSLPGCHTLRVSKEVKPVVMPNRRIPISVRPKLKEELERLVALDVIAPVNDPTPWVSQVIITPK